MKGSISNAAALKTPGLAPDLTEPHRQLAIPGSLTERQPCSARPLLHHGLGHDQLKSCGVAQRELLPDVEHRQSLYLNNRAENSHRPTRRRERQMQRFKSPRQAQRFLSAHSFIYGHFRPRRHLLTALSYRMMRALAFQVWQEETCARNAA